MCLSLNLSGNLGVKYGPRSDARVQDGNYRRLSPSHPTTTTIMIILLCSPIGNFWWLHHHLHQYFVANGIGWITQFLLFPFGDADGRDQHHCQHITSIALVRRHCQDSKFRAGSDTNSGEPRQYIIIYELYHHWDTRRAQKMVSSLWKHRPIPQVALPVLYRKGKRLGENW